MLIVGGFQDLWRGGASGGGGLSGPTLWILANRTSGVAPAGVFFEAIVSGYPVSRPAHDLRFKWTFGDTGDYTALNIDHPHGRAVDTAYGPMAAHCYAAPGSYTVLLEVTDGLQVTTATCDVVVTAAADAFPGASTYAISGPGDFAGAASGAVQVADLAAALAHAEGAGRRSARFQFCGGVTHAVPSTVSAAHFDSLHLSGYGTGGAPVLSSGLSVAEGSLSGAISVDGLTLRGSFDPRVGGAAPATGIAISGAASVTLHDLDVAGFGTGIQLAEGQANAVLANSRISDWAETGLDHRGADRSAVLGSSLLMHVDTLAEAVADGPGRLGGALSRYVLWHCDLFSAGGQPTHAPCWRWNTDAAAGASGVIGQCRMEGGAPVLALSPAAPTTFAEPGELVVEKCYLLGSAASGDSGVMSMGYGGTSLRNSVLVQPDVAPEHGLDAPAFLTGGGAGSLAANDAAPVQIYSNGFVDLRSPATLANALQGFAIEDGPGFAHWTSLTIENNLTHAPNLGAPLTPHAPVNAAQMFAPLYRGRRDSGGFDPSYATPASSAAVFGATPGPGGLPAVAAGTVALDDFFGVLRGASAEVGAIEFSSDLAMTFLSTGTFEVSGVEAGLVQFTVDASARHAGTYPVDLAALQNSPIVLTAPSASGAITTGSALTAVSGLVAHLVTDGEPITEWSWQRAAVEVGTGPIYVVQAEDHVAGLTLMQTVTNAAPSAAFSSGGIIGAAVPTVSGTTGSPVITSDATHDYYTFNAVGSIAFSDVGLVDVEVLGGGGGGAGGNYTSGGGGGAGALVLTTSVAVAATNYPVLIGDGGAAGIGTAVAAIKGGDSSALGITAPGGGAGRTSNSLPAAAAYDGPCGGGGYSGGNIPGGAGSVGGAGGRGAGGGSRSGGGGGMGGAGGDGIAEVASGDGGAAVQSAFDGIWLAEGGAGGVVSASGTVGTVTHGGGTGGQRSNGGAGMANTGSGGGGAGSNGTISGGPGGSGRIVIRIPKSV